MEEGGEGGAEAVLGEGGEDGGHCDHRGGVSVSAGGRRGMVRWAELIGRDGEERAVRVPASWWWIL